MPKFKTKKNSSLLTLISKFVSLSPLDEMGHRIDDLERNIADLINQAGAEEQHLSR
jgi:hypothetical protein